MIQRVQYFDQSFHPKSADNQDKWVKNVSNRGLTQPEKNIPAKGLNFALFPKQLTVVDLITATESPIGSNNLALAEAEQLRMKASEALASVNIPLI